tara:strand:+ start:1169 stop:1561 length:393 start_codon:yes stop_codon:yes gene_type:complete
MNSCENCEKDFPEDNLKESLEWCGKVCEKCWKMEAPLRDQFNKEQEEMNENYKIYKANELKYDLARRKFERNEYTKDLIYIQEIKYLEKNSKKNSNGKRFPTKSKILENQFKYNKRRRQQRFNEKWKNHI